MESYAGTALIKTPSLTISALGAYQKLNGQPSLFVYAVADHATGIGPPLLRLKGMAVGFGYNRSVRIPGLHDVKDFPLVSVATGNTDLGKDPFAVLSDIKTHIPPHTNALFLALGIKFTAFEIIDSFALLIVQLQGNLKLDALGVSTLSVPAKAAKPQAVIEIAWKASYDFDENAFKLDGALTPASFIFTKKCKLSGQFAFYSWFEGVHAGDFVFTVGGYHSNFKKPSHYPEVPRIQFQWEVFNEKFDEGIIKGHQRLELKGSMYWALTPMAMMAGGHFEAIYRFSTEINYDFVVAGHKFAGVSLSGDVQVYFAIGADFLIAWEPFSYEAEAWLRFGIKARFKGSVYADLLLFTISESVEAGFDLSLGADLQLWGPEFAGKALIDWDIVSFEIEFGAQEKPECLPLTWAAFKTGFLPPEASNPTPEERTICAITLEAGGIKQLDDDDRTWVVNPAEIAITTDSPIPATGFDVDDTQKSVGIAPMDITSVTASTHTIEVLNNSNVDVTGEFRFEPIFKNMPAAIWGNEFDPGLNNDQQLVEDMLAGYRITPRPKDEPEQTESKPVKDFRYDIQLEDNAFAWSDALVFNYINPNSDTARRAKIRDINSGTAKSNRNSLLADLGIDASGVDLGNLTDSTLDDFLVAPQIVTIQ